MLWQGVIQFMCNNIYRVLFFLLFILLIGTPAVGQPGSAVNVALTAEEEAWLAQHPVINVRVSRSYPPFEFYDGGQFQGIAYDYLTLLGGRLGVEFKPTPELSWGDAR